MEIRKALLDHYTQQSAGHATDALSMAIIGLTVALVPSLDNNIKLMGLSMAGAFMFRMYFTSFYWSYMADAIIKVHELSEDEIKKLKIQEDKNVNTDLKIYQFHIAAHRSVADSHKIIIQFSSMSHWCSWGITICVGIGIFITLLIFRVQF